MQQIGEAASTPCWHCGTTIELVPGAQAARYIYRGEQPRTVIVEDWMLCSCGA